MFFKYIKKQDKNSSKNKDHSNRANSVRIDKKRKILFLREEKWKFEFTKTDIKNFFNKGAYRISIFLIFTMSVVIISLSSTSTASVAQFYSNSCLGGWENSGNAKGAPQVFDGSEEMFSASTSAILRNSMSEIFCGDFQAEISDNSTIRKAVLKLSWQVEGEFGPTEEKPASTKDYGVAKEEAAVDTETIIPDDVLPDETPLESSPSEIVDTTEEVEITEPAETSEEETKSSEITTIESDDFASSLQDILDAPSGTLVEFTLTEENEVEAETENASDEELVPETEPVAIEQVPEQEQVSDELVEENSSDEISFFKKFSKVVFAAEEDSLTVQPAEEQISSSDSNITTIESDDFASSLQDILDAPSDTSVEFTLIFEEETTEDDHVTVIEGDDLTSSLQDILDSPSDIPVEFILTDETADEAETTSDDELIPDTEPAAEQVSEQEQVSDESAEEDSSDEMNESGEIISVETIDGSDDLMAEVEDIEIHSVESDTIILDAEKMFDGDTILSGAVARANDFLEVEYTFDSINWQHLGFVGVDNWRDTEFELPVVEWNELEKLQVRIKNLPTIDEQPVVYLDSMWIEITHYKGKILRPAKLKDLSRKKNFSFNDELKFEFEFEKKETTGLDAVLDSIKGLFSGRKFNVNKVQIINARGEKEEIESFVEYRGKKTISIIIKPKNRAVRPGKYILETYVETDDGETVVKYQDFYLGVLAINVNKSIYLPKERAYLQMAALTDTGHTICDAELWMSIVDPEGIETDLSTENGTIYLSGECNGNNVTDVPDYFAYYDVNDVGTYTMKLINLDTGHEIEDSFEVRNEVAFEVERVGPTRIYPPATYQVTMYVTAEQDFNGDIIEYVPDSFKITNTSLVINNGSTTVTLLENIIIGKSEKEIKTTEIVWFADIKKGDICTLSYEFDAPDISPEFYLLGPLEFYE